MTYEEYNSNRAKYTRFIAEGPYPEVGSDAIHSIKVDQPHGEIRAQVFVPTDDAIREGGLMMPDGRLPVHVNYHGGKLGILTSWFEACETVADGND